MSLLVDAIVAVHDPSRPVDRAVASLTRSGLRPGTELRITVVCHNVAADAFDRRLEPYRSDGLRVITLADGIRSPAGPFNAGIDAAAARYVSILGSDDHLEDGALAHWLARAERDGADAVIAPEAHANGGVVRTPPVRPFHRGRRDPIKDRLAYRTAPLGLIARSAIERLSLRFTPGLATGEDQAFSARLWFEGGRVSYAKGAPRYIVGADAMTRVSTSPQPLDVQFAFASPLLESAWFTALPPAARRAIVVKLLRVHVFPAALARIDSPDFAASDQVILADLVRRMRTAAPVFERSLSIADRRTVDVLLDPGAAVETVGRLVRARQRYGHPSTVLTSDPRGLLLPDGPLRFMAASWLMR